MDRCEECKCKYGWESCQCECHDIPIELMDFMKVHLPILVEKYRKDRVEDAFGNVIDEL